MLQLKSIRIYQFKNYKTRKIAFNHLIMGITGKNGIGKTNLLDAIYYLGFTKSYFTAKEKNNFTHGTNAFSIEGDFIKKGKKEKVVCLLKNGKKEVVLNNKPYEKFSLHIGAFPMVFIAPDDNVLISGGSNVRRKFLDVLLSQIDARYINDLIAYQKIKSQRDKLLKDSDGNPDKTLLDTFDNQLVSHGEPIYERRKAFLIDFEPKIKSYYRFLSGGKEEISIRFESDLGKQPFAEILRNNRSKDRVLQRTSKGIHRDDIIFELEGNPMKDIGSQGQKKSFVFGLKLAQFDVLKAYNEDAPILLLDDIFEKLDLQRIERLIQLIGGEGFGQVFITDTESDRLQTIFKEANIPLQLIQL